MWGPWVVSSFLVECWITAAVCFYLSNWLCFNHGALWWSLFFPIKDIHVCVSAECEVYSQWRCCCSWSWRSAQRPTKDSKVTKVRCLDQSEIFFLLSWMWRWSLKASVTALFLTRVSSLKPQLKRNPWISSAPKNCKKQKQLTGCLTWLVISGGGKQALLECILWWWGVQGCPYSWLHPKCVINIWMP